MQVSRELELAMSNDMQKIKSVDVEYMDGTTVSGFITHLSHPFNIILCKHVTSLGENSNHSIRFTNASKISLIYHGGDIKVFE